MGKILLEIPRFPDSVINAENLDDAITKLKELDKVNDPLETIKRFKGIVKQTGEISESDLYKQ